MVEFFSVPLFSNDSDIYITNWGLLSDVQIKCLLVDRLHCVYVYARARASASHRRRKIPNINRKI